VIEGMDVKKVFSNPKNLVYRLSVAGILVLAFWMASTFWQDGALLAGGTRAPDWRLPRVDHEGRQIGLEELRGKVVVLDFWGISCPPCIRQIEVLEQIHRQMAPRGVAVVGIAIQEEPIEDIRAFVAQRRPGYPIAVDKGQVARAYKVHTIPTLYILDRNGLVVSSHRGLMDRESLSRAVGQAVNR
jgi:peroxiredoxin